MPASFTKPLAWRLDALSGLSIKEAASGDRLVPNQVLIAPGGKHVEVRRVGGHVTAVIRDGEAVSGVRDADLGDFQPPVLSVVASLDNEKACSEASTSAACGDVCNSDSGKFTLCGLDFLSNRDFSGFIEPVTNSVFFEDPRSRTRLRTIFITTTIPEDNPVLAGGDYQVFGAQVTAALSERWTFISQKDGYITLQADALPNEDGRADIATGLKYVFVRDVENQFILSGGMMYEWSNGSSDVFQGNGDGVFNFFVTSGKEFGQCGDWHFVNTLGWHLPAHGGQESESMFYSAHLDRRFTSHLYGLCEMTWTHWLASGDRLPGVGFEGNDLINLGAGNVAGNDLVTMAIGVYYKFSQHVELAGAWEFPVTDREDLLADRATVFLNLVY